MKQHPPRVAGSHELPDFPADGTEAGGGSPQGQQGQDMQQVWMTAPRNAAWFVEEAKREAALMATGVPMGLPTGFRVMDRSLRLREGQLIVLAARSSMGKTSLALQIAMHNALNLRDAWDDGCVVMFSAEMSGAELFQKMASIQSGVNLQDGYAGRWSADNARAFNDALDGLSDLPLIVNDLNAITTQHMRENLATLKNAGKPPRMIVFDYIELGADNDRLKENERVSQIVYRLKQIARDLKIPVLALSQINREIEKESRHRLPMMHNLAGSDAVGRTADKVLTMLVPNYYLRTGIACACEYIEDSRNTAYVSVQKDRFGARAHTFRLRFHPQTASFHDIDPTDPRGPYVLRLQTRTPDDATRYWQNIDTQVAAPAHSEPKERDDEDNRLPQPAVAQAGFSFAPADEQAGDE